MFAGGDGEFFLRIVVDPVAQRGQHLGRSFAGGADDEDVAKLLFVGAVECDEGVAGFAGGGVDTGLLVAGPLARPGGDCFGRLLFADPGMTAKGFESVVTIE